MAYITLKNNDLLGISGLLHFRPETAIPLMLLADTLLHQDHPTLSRGEREMIAAHVSWLNECIFCHHSHAAAAIAGLNAPPEFMEELRKPAEQINTTSKMKALLAIAACVQKSGKAVDAASIEKAKQAGATDIEIHDTVLIAAAFCMYNRYVDGLGTEYPKESQAYIEMGRRMHERGYGKK